MAKDIVTKDSVKKKDKVYCWSCGKVLYKEKKKSSDCTTITRESYRTRFGLLDSHVIVCKCNEITELPYGILD